MHETLVQFAIVDITEFIAVSENQSRFGYWPPLILLVALVLQALNNIRIDRARKRAGEPHKDGAKMTTRCGSGLDDLISESNDRPVVSTGHKLFGLCHLDYEALSHFLGCGAVSVGQSPADRYPRNPA